MGYTGDDPFGLVALAKQTGDPIDDPAFQSIYRLVVNDRTGGVKVGRADDGAVATLLGYDAIVDTLVTFEDTVGYGNQVLLLNRNAVVMADELLDVDEVARVNDLIRAARVTQDESPEVLDFTLTEIRQRAAGRPPVGDPTAELAETLDEMARLQSQQPVGRVVEATKPEKWFDEAANVEEVIESMPKTGDNRLDWNDPKVSNDPALREIIKTQWPDAGVQQLTVGEMEDAIAEGRTVLYRGFGADDRLEVDQFVQEFIDPGDTTYVGQGLFGNGTYASDVEDIADDFATNKFGIGTGRGEWEHGTVVEMVVEADAKIALYEPLEQEMLQAAQPLNSQIEEIKKTTLSVTEAMQRYDDIDIQRGNTLLGPDYMRNWPVESMKDIAGADHPWFSEPAVIEAIAELKRLGETVELLYTDVGRYAASQGVDIIEVVRPKLTGFNFSEGVTTTEVPGNYYVILNRSAVGVTVG